MESSCLAAVLQDPSVLPLFLTALSVHSNSVVRFSLHTCWLRKRRGGGGGVCCTKHFHDSETTNIGSEGLVITIALAILTSTFLTFVLVVDLAIALFIHVCRWAG